MNKETQSIVMTLLGGLLLSITFSGSYTSYVKPGFGPLLIIAGVVLVLVGVASLVSTIRSEVRQGRERADRDAHVRAGDSAGKTGATADPASHPGPDAHGHDHDRSRAPWLMMAPVLVLLLMAPPALGAEAVTRNAGSQAIEGLADMAQPESDPAPDSSGGKDAVGNGGGGYAFNDGSGHGEGTAAFAKKRPTKHFPALPTGSDPAIGIKDFVMRALYDADNSVTLSAVTVTGFIAGSGDGYPNGYSIARLVVSCCAADASPMRVHVDGASPLPVNTWVTAVLKAQTDTATQDNDYVPTVSVVSMKATSQPSDPYEH